MSIDQEDFNHAWEAWSLNHPIPCNDKDDFTAGYKAGRRSMMNDRPVGLSAMQRAVEYLKGLIWTIDHNEIKGIAHQISCDQEEIVSIIKDLEEQCTI